MTRTSLGKEVSEDEAVAFHDYAVSDGERRREHRAAISEGVKLSALAARIDIGGKVIQKGLIELAPGERSRQRARVDARDARAQAAGNHLPRELARVSSPQRKDRRQFRRSELLLAVGSNVFEKEIAEREAVDRFLLGPR